MLAHYLHLGLRSLRRNPILTALMVMAIGFGVAASATTYSVFRAVSGDPIPSKSSQLFTPQIDNWGPQARRESGNELPDALSYTDAMALMRAHKARRQAAMYSVSFSLVPADATRMPFSVFGYATYADFFPMFDVPFSEGSGWNHDDDRNHANVVVISSKLNRRLFGGGDSVGKQVSLDGHPYRIVGVVDHWNPQPRFFDAANGYTYGQAPDFYMPFTRAIDLHTNTAGNNNCAGKTGDGWDGWLHSECVWIAFWAELPDAAAVQSYRNFLQGYAADQQQAGRFGWKPRTRLRNVMQWLDQHHAVPPESQMSLLLALGFLFVCLVNTVGLLLAKFMRRAGEIGVRRALGASRREVYLQFLSEAAMVGAAGGVLGLLLTGLGMFGVGLVFQPEIARLAHFDPSLVALTVLVSVLATVMAALYPTWRAAQVQPAWQLRSN
jgi:putative ABC transport system permease protein